MRNHSSRWLLAVALLPILAHEDNWVWSPQGVVDMHQPEQWGYVEFSAAPPGALSPGHPAGAPLRLSGYRNRVAGERIAYHSPHPLADTALLARSRRENHFIAWQTDTVPATITADTVEFTWVAGLSGNMGVHQFSLSIDGSPQFHFTTSPDSAHRSWTHAGPAGGSLSFRATLVDRFRDIYGYMTLRLPRGMLSPGKPLTLSVTGEEAGSEDWYMTFQHRLSPHPTIGQDPVLLRVGDSTESQLRIVLDNLEGARWAFVSVAGHHQERTALGPDANVILVPAGSGSAEHDVGLTVRIDSTITLDTVVHIAPVTQRDVYLLSYSHNDIGYSDLQERVERKQWRNIDSALALIQRTREYLPDARFRWNVEVLWPLESWLGQASPAVRDSFFTLVRAGSIGLNGFYGNPMSGLAAEREMTHFFDYARRLRDNDSVPITTAQITDVPGQSWGIVPALAQSGIHWLAMGPNASDRIGTTLETWGDRPFYWVSQSGRDTVLTWMAGASYSAFHMERIRPAGERVLFGLMRRLEQQQYPYTQVQLPYTIDGDNGGGDPDLPDYVRSWNRRYVSPRLIIATHARMFGDFAAAEPRLPVVAGDFTGYWEDGAGSTAYETALARNASSRLVQAEVVDSLLSARVPRDAFYAAWRDVVLWDEHTWGAAASITTPDAADVVSQWRYKQRFALEADSLSRALLENALAHRGAPVPNAFDVFNTTEWSRTELVLVPVELSRAGDRVLDGAGRAVPSQRLSSGELAVLVSHIPGRSWQRYTVRRESAASSGRARAEGARLESDRLLAVLDTLTGAIASLTWKPAGVELVDPSAHRGLNQYLYVAGTDSAKASSATSVVVRVKDRGPLVASLSVQVSAPGARAVTSEIRLIAGLDRIDLTTVIDKSPVRDKEGVHLAFPFNLPGAQARYDVASGIVRPNLDQLPGSARNVIPVQSWVDISSDSLGVTWATVDAPLVELGGINAESPWMRDVPVSATVYSYVMNNYWHTNFKADQSGPVRFRYSIRVHRAFQPDEAVRFGEEAREPLLVTEAAGRLP